MVSGDLYALQGGAAAAGGTTAEERVHTETGEVYPQTAAHIDRGSLLFLLTSMFIFLLFLKTRK